MKKKWIAELAVGAFILACLIPGAGMFLLPQTPAAANQTLARPPRLTTAEGSFNPDVLREASDYIGDHFAFRQELITAKAALDAALFRTSSSEDVVLGREGWLFYRDTLPSYLHTQPMTDRELYAAAHTLALMREYVEGRGARFYVTVAPNKASLYPQYLANVGEPLPGEDDIDRLRPWLERENISYLDLFSPFRQAEEVLYYAQDSHWTTRGAALAHDALIQGLGKADQTPFFSGSVHAGEAHRGDLYEMLYPAGRGTEADAAYDRAFAFTYLRTPRGPDDQRIETENPDASGNLLMFRDSFGNALHPFLADAYGKALFSRAMPYTLELLEDTGADTVLVELVERNLSWWAERAPIFPAPRRTLTGEVPAGETQGTCTLTADGRLAGHVRLEGRVLGQVDDDSPLYVQLGDRLYEASPAGEAGEGAPFTLYVEEGAAGESLSVLFLRGGELSRTAPVLIQK